MPSSKKEKIFLIALIAVAFIIRLAAVLKYGDFWDDEMFSFVYSQKPWLDSVKFWLWETNPPLHMLLLKLWFYIFPATEFWARIPSLIFGVLNVWLIYIFAKKIFGARTAVLSALLLALLPYHIYISATARVYSLLVFLASASMYFFYLIFTEENQSKKYVWKYAAINLLMLLTHLSAPLLLVCQLVILLAIKKPVYRWVKINFLVGSLAACWLVPAFAFKARADVAASAWFLKLSTDFDQLARQVFLLIGGPNTFPVVITGLCFVIFLACAYLWFFKKDPSRAQGKIMVFFWAVLTVIICLVAGLINIKFFIVAMPAAVMIVAETFNNFLSGKKIYLAVSLVLAYCLYTIWLASSILPISNWSPTCDFIQAHYAQEEKQAFVYNSPFLKNQIDRYCPNIPMRRLAYYLNQSDWDYDYITRNYIFYSHPPKEIRQWMEANKISRYQSLVLLEDQYEHMPHIAVELKSQGWKLKSWQKATNLGEYLLFFYVHNPSTAAPMEK